MTWLTGRPRPVLARATEVSMGCHPVTHAILSHFGTGPLYARVISPDLPGGEAG
ncbi:hypothetical protein [Streptomyces sp. LaBMicrA B280]|uniref:hypothetical protein n=1 Tax=Streptomyces sp. LaBMicrA B280 TaxID=3391001 RepID=UPI003BA491D2